jgi:hypothetical protein
MKGQQFMIGLCFGVIIGFNIRNKLKYLWS